MSSRPLRTTAGSVVMASSMCWMLGRMRCWARRRRRGADARGAGEVEEMGALDVVELERSRERVQDRLGGAGSVAALEPRVITERTARS
jgi:hypothetical protein